MSEKNDPVEIIEDSDIVEQDFTPEELEDDKTDWKAKATELKGIAKRRATKLAKLKETSLSLKKSDKSDKPSKEKTSELGYGEKAFLNSNDIKGKAEHELAQRIMQETGRSLEDVIEGKYFLGELKDLREADAVATAMPDGSKRAGASPKTTADYWIAKGGLPPDTAENIQLRRDVVNARLKQAESSSNFTDNSVVGK
jgi:hypothetical protein